MTPNIQFYGEHDEKTDKYGVSIRSKKPTKLSNGPIDIHMEGTKLENVSIDNEGKAELSHVETNAPIINRRTGMLKGDHLKIYIGKHKRTILEIVLIVFNIIQFFSTFLDFPKLKIFP
jgi:hypothetical protein